MIRIYDWLESIFDRTIGYVSGVIGDSSSGESWDSDCNVAYPPGYCALPANPSNGIAAEAVCLEQSDRNLILGVRDARSGKIAGALSPGETTLFAQGADGNGQGRIMLKDKNGVSTISLYTTEGNSADGTSIILTLSSEGSFAVAMPKAFIQISKEGDISLGNNAAAISITAAGSIVLSGKEAKIGCQANMIGLGATAATAAVLSASPIVAGVAPGAPLPVLVSKSVFVGL